MSTTLGFKYSASEAEPIREQSFEPLPRGKYPIQIENAELKDFYDGRQVSLTLVVREGTYENRRLFYNFFISHQVVEKQTKGRQHMTSVLQAVGLDSIEDLAVLLGKRATANVGYSSPNTFNGKDYPARNTVWGLFPDDGKVPAAQTPAKTAPSSEQSTGAPSAPPKKAWMKTRAPYPPVVASEEDDETPEEW
jgi:hypothetical protein